MKLTVSVLLTLLTVASGFMSSAPVRSADSAHGATQAEIMSSPNTLEIGRQGLGSSRPRRAGL